MIKNFLSKSLNSSALLCCLLKLNRLVSLLISKCQISGIKNTQYRKRMHGAMGLNGNGTLFIRVNMNIRHGNESNANHYFDTHFSSWHISTADIRKMISMLETCGANMGSQTLALLTIIAIAYGSTNFFDISFEIHGRTCSHTISCVNWYNGCIVNPLSSVFKVLDWFQS